MKFIIVCLVAVAWFQLAQAQGSVYVKFFPTSMNFLEADRTCQSLGGILPDINSKAAQDVVVNYIKTSPEISNADRNAKFWIGRDDTANEAVWRTSQGGASTGFGWCGGEPNNAGNNEDCAVFYMSRGCLYDAACDVKNPFICAFLM